MNEYVLAMYDVRGKQDYIFRGRQLKEIAGASFVIRDIFRDELFPAAAAYASKMNLKGIVAGDETEFIYNYKNKKEEESAFSQEQFEMHLSEGYLGEIVYDGGGNFFILYKNKEVFCGINKIFTRNVLEHTYSLTVLCSCVENVDFDNYAAFDSCGRETLSDSKRLYEENRRREARINPQMPAQVLPFTQVDYANSLPIYTREKSELTREAAHKLSKYENEQTEKKFDEKNLDSIVRKKGEDSWLAVVYIDGNNMGAKVQAILEPEKDSETGKVSYERAIKALRSFSNKIQKDYIDDRLKAIDDALEEKYADNTGRYKRRLVVYAGDEINLILNAHDAYDAIKAYFRDMPDNASACAGIALFRSHVPYDDAYHIAEQCCENAKSVMKKYGMGDVSLLDFHYCQGATGTDIKNIREREAGSIISKPWFMKYDCKKVGSIPSDEVYTAEMVQELVNNLNTCTRTNIKGLLECAKTSEAGLMSELKRMQIRRENAQNLKEITDISDINGEKVNPDQLRKLIYDIVSVYDLWFRPEKQKDQGK